MGKCEISYFNVDCSFTGQLTGCNEDKVSAGLMLKHMS